MAREKVGLKGYVRYKVFDSEGNIKETREKENLITDAGLASVSANILSDVSSNDYDAIAIGTGDTSPDSSDTSLETETHRNSGSDVTGSQVTNNVSDDTAELVTTFDFDSSEAITESGLFNDSSGGDMLARQTFSAINVEDGDSLEVTWQITFS